MHLSTASVANAQGLAGTVTPTAACAPHARADLTRIGSWGYQLQDIDPDEIAASSYEMVVVDAFANGEPAVPFNTGDIARMQRMPDGRHRTVLAYLSIGEAEDYRFYWQDGWERLPPAWLKAENPDWPRNYAVRYWDPAWQALILGSPQSYLDRILSAGFDGVYLDRIDGFDVSDTAMDRRRRMSAMAEFVVSLATYARERVSGFAVVAQNGEELLADSGYRSCLDGLGKEDLLFGVRGDGMANPKSVIRASLSFIEPFIADGKPVFLVEYLTDPAQIATARRDAAVLGAPLLIAGRRLNDIGSR